MAAMILPDKKIIGKVSGLKLSPARATDAPSATLTSVLLLAKLSNAAPLLLAYYTTLILLLQRGGRESS